MCLCVVAGCLPAALCQAKELLRDLERLLQLSCESARVLCSHMEAVAGDLVELGRNMGMMSKVGPWCMWGCWACGGHAWGLGRGCGVHELRLGEGEDECW